MIYQGSIDTLTGAHKYFLKTDNVTTAKKVITTYAGTNIAIDDDHTVTFNLKNSNETPKIIKALVQNDVNVYTLYGKKKSLEDVFLELTGGETK